MQQRLWRRGSDPTRTEFLGYIVEGARRMERLLDDLLLYARVAQPRRRSRASPIDAGLALDAAMMNLAQRDRGERRHGHARRRCPGRDARDRT